MRRKDYGVMVAMANLLLLNAVDYLFCNKTLVNWWYHHLDVGDVSVVGGAFMNFDKGVLFIVEDCALFIFTFL